MEWLKQLQGAVNYMEAHLLEQISYEDVADSVHMSGYHFHRTFCLVAGMTANEYIRSRRLSLAAQELQSGEITVLDVALKYGYETPESFSKAFSRFHGVTPKQAKRKGISLRMFGPLAIKITLEGGTVMDYRIVKAKRQRFLTLTRVFPNEIINDDSNHSISDFWKECKEKGLVEPIRDLRPAGKRDLYGLCSSKKDENGNFSYGIGVLIDLETDMRQEQMLLEKGYTIWETEPAEYAVFKCFGEDGGCISEMWSRFFKEFLPQSGYRQTELTDYEIYYEKGESGLFCELWIPVKR